MTTVAELLKSARSESTNSKELHSIWFETTSTRVRKAIASNPNCDTNTLAMASRLYVKEVVNNPSFEILKVFNEDPIVEKIYEAYNNPSGFVTSNNPYSMKNSVLQNSVAKAILISPKLKASRHLENFVIPSLSTHEIIRELKDEDVKNNVRGVVVKDIFKNTIIPIQTLKLYHDWEIINEEEFRDGIKNLNPNHNFSPHKSFISTFNRLLSSGNYDALFGFLFAHAPRCIGHLSKEFKSGKLEVTDGFFKVLGDVYRDLVYCEVVRSRDRVVFHRSKYGWAGNINLWSENEHTCKMFLLLWSIITKRNSLEDTSIKEIDLESLYEDLKLIGFNRDSGPYQIPFKFNCLNTLTARSIACQKLLEIKDDEIFEFYVSSGMLWQEWYAKSDKNNIESKVVERIHGVNSKRGFKYYHSSVLDVFPYIRVNTFNGLDYEQRKYFNLESSGFEFPKVSGKLTEEMLQWAVNSR